MSNRQYYRDLLLRVQDKIRGLGSTNKNRWASFCYSGSMSCSEFADKMKKYNVQFKDNDMDVIWNSILGGNDMKFTDFLKFMQTDVDDFEPVLSSAPAPSRSSYEQPSSAYESPNSNYNPPSYGNERTDRYSDDRFGRDNYGGDRFGQDNFGGDRFGAPQPNFGGNADDLIHENLRDIIISCMSKDSLITGEVSKNAFIDICAKLGIFESTPGFNKILQMGDPSYTGLIQYFTVAAKICSASAASFAPAPSYGQNYQSSYEPPKNSYAYENPAPRVSIRPPPEENISLSDTNSRYDDQPRKGAYQSSIGFGNDLGAAPRQRRAAMEESNIFGESPQRRSLPVGETRPQVMGGNADDVLAKISAKVTENIGNSSAAFNKWKGYNTRLTAADLCKGLQRDCDYNPPLAVVEEILARYGGELSLTGFVKMMGDGTNVGKEQNQRPKSSFQPSGRKMTEDDQTIEDIASQFNGRDFEQLTGRARNAEDLCNIFRRNNIQFNEARVKKLIAKQGKNGFCDSVLSRLGH